MAERIGNLVGKTFTGKAIESVFDGLATLRIAVFHDFPYLYEGSVEYEREYLQTYFRAERSFLYAIFDGEQMVGATTAIPLRDEMPEIQQPFIDAGYNVADVFYFGESILLKTYRGLGLGHRFFDEREAYARSWQQYKLAAFCSVERPENHPAKPADYRPNDTFWLKRGYQKSETLKGFMDWPDIGKTESSRKTMIFWTKEL